MGCGKVWDLPWRYADELMVKEVAQQRSENWPDTIREKTREMDQRVVGREVGSVPGRKGSAYQKGESG